MSLIIDIVISPILRRDAVGSIGFLVMIMVF